MAIKKLSDKDIDLLQKDLPEWSVEREAGLIQKEFQFLNFSDAMVFVNNVAQVAEEVDHHPDICISYNSVTVILTTHEAGGLTKKDADLVRRIEKMRE